MLLLKNRLRKKQEFENVFKKGKSFFCENISLRIVNNDLKSSRIGIVVSGKFSKKAVERNRIKRQLREVLRKILPMLKAGEDIVVTPLKKKKESVQDLQAKVEKALKKAKIIN